MDLRRDMKKIISVTIAIITMFSAVYSQGKVMSTKPCSVGAYVADNDPNGLNVRATPDKIGKIIHRLIKGDGDISLDITATSGGGWVKITNAWHGDTGEEFNGTGWVFATMLATGTKGFPNYDSPAKLYSTPSKKSKVLMQIPAENEVVILDCRGNWAKVSYKGTSGWLARDNQCGSPFTTCN
jgi:SH3-like domain-containing protein